MPPHRFTRLLLWSGPQELVPRCYILLQIESASLLPQTHTCLFLECRFVFRSRAGNFSR
ncbi:unnamed protein product [Rhodiola kirilowii]